MSLNFVWLNRFTRYVLRKNDKNEQIYKKFLDENEELRKFILHNSHLDFAIYSQTINKPILAIEVDGKDHEKIEQKERDEKKERILKYMEIPLIRIKSKAAFEENELYDEIEKYEHEVLAKRA